MTTGAAVEISGLWKRCPPGKEQTHELQATEVTVVGEADVQVGSEQYTPHGIYLLTSVTGIDIPNPEKVPLSRLPPANSSPPTPNTLQLPPATISV